MKLSIAVPVYECHGIGWLYLTELFNSIVKQSEKDIEVVISDQSTDDNIKDLCVYYSKFLNVKYVSGHHLKRSNSPNTNNAILNCSCDMIKVIFQDDFFIDESGITKLIDAFNSGSNWILSGSAHCTNIHSLYKPFVPRYTSKIIEGDNTISSPSVMSFRGKHLFDENLVMLMDCEMYKRLYDLYGEPTIIQDFMVCNRMHDKQLQNQYENLIETEKKYCLEKYKGN
jgi:glycosyltransferase involved in cell wall biosynthesis